MIDFLEPLISGGLFLTVAIIALAVLIISSFFDADLGDGAFSLTTLSAFVSLFGFAGFLSLKFGAPSLVAVAIGVGAGLVAGVLSMIIMNTLKSGQSTESISTSEIVGQKASVSLVIPKDRAGEVCFLKNGHMHYYIAYADKAIAQGSSVTITNILSNDSVKVSVSE